jgi:hypothetical protein
MTSGILTWLLVAIAFVTVQAAPDMVRMEEDVNTFGRLCVV